MSRGMGPGRRGGAGHPADAGSFKALGRIIKYLFKFYPVLAPMIIV